MTEGRIIRHILWSFTLSCDVIDYTSPVTVRPLSRLHHVHLSHQLDVTGFEMEDGNSVAAKTDARP
jgi:hypothetical protein